MKFISYLTTLSKRQDMFWIVWRETDKHSTDNSQHRLTQMMADRALLSDLKMARLADLC